MFEYCNATQVAEDGDEERDRRRGGWLTRVVVAFLTLLAQCVT